MIVFILKKLFYGNASINYFVILKYLPWRCSMIVLDGAKNVIFAWKLELSLVVVLTKF